jgi:ribonuclease BN (tRNA processing enzyme)
MAPHVSSLMPVDAAHCASGESGAQMSQVDVVLFSHFHIDHSSDFPALVFSSWFEERKRPLPVYGPPGNDFMPSTTEFVRDLFGEPR